MVEHPPLEILKIELDRALDNKDAFNGKLDQMISRNPCQPRLFYHFLMLSSILQIKVKIIQKSYRCAMLQLQQAIAGYLKWFNIHRLSDMQLFYE